MSAPVSRPRSRAKSSSTPPSEELSQRYGGWCRSIRRSSRSETRCVEASGTTRNHNDITARSCLTTPASAPPPSQHLGTPLHHAVAWNHSECASFLLGAGADIEARTEDLCTPLHYALYEGHEGCIALLLRRGADRFARDRVRFTLPLVTIFSLCFAFR